jgi:phospholipid/cholesterol/gamma-HCH transport system substrate-binding protein
MKFRIRYADRVVGFLVLIGLISLLTVIFLLGSKQRWFSRDFRYITYPASAAGLSVNMPVAIKGLPIGVVKSIELTGDDRVEVIFTIYNKYNDRVRQGSLIQILVSPIGLGNQFVFHPGLGNELLKENDLVPSATSQEGKDLIASGLGFIPSQSDSLAILINNVDELLRGLNKTVDEVNLALEGNQDSVLGRTLGDVEKTVAILPDSMANLEKLTADISVLTGELADPEGTVISSLESSLVSVSLILNNLEKTTDYLPREMPQIVSLISSLQATLRSADDVLVALSNNPLLRNGIPEHAEVDNSGTNPRNISF